ncbi:hypothetical protein G3N56_09490 [Desulfovibrio sulfodismutans]|uniref:Uncharacterized protein n=1 Tax=Desulfolutivibrio sulfodismutans TaxID=63561 RepID=A0A7K3NMB5_9BACT|nr:hypothetical protein [Desulfolutivibrio sulfodismutans]NDY56973.1 hypothetical protein [Desulfolutivibrio sulfodismutans]QLA12080.1 hypothetical protein GD606_07245 [Desulfolutivibrio sulfodismutans DSM 3696]
MHNEIREATVELTLDERAMDRFAGLFASGVGVEMPGPCGLDVFLGENLGLDPAYVRERLRTIFVNGQPVDDIAKTKLAPGDELALSVAMPGLVGICMRLDSPLKSFRGDITHGRAASRSHLGDLAGTVTVKLFNFIAREIGPGLLARGVTIVGGKLARAVADGKGIVAVRFGDADCGVSELAAQFQTMPDAAYFVRAAQNTP